MYRCLFTTFVDSKLWTDAPVLKSLKHLLVVKVRLKLGAKFLLNLNSLLTIVLLFYCRAWTWTWSHHDNKTFKWHSRGDAYLEGKKKEKNNTKHFRTAAYKLETQDQKFTNGLVTWCVKCLLKMLKGIFIRITIICKCEVFMFTV